MDWNNNEVFGHVLMNQVKRQQRMPQVIQHAHENHQIKTLRKGGDVPDGHAAEVDVEAGDFGGEAGLREVVLVGIDADYTRAAPRRLSSSE